MTPSYNATVQLNVFSILLCICLSTEVTALARNNVKRPVLALTSFALQSARESSICVKESEGKGLGAYTETPILSGAWVGEYSGEILTLDEVQSRYWASRKKTLTDRRWIKSRKKRNQGLTGDYLFDMGDDLYIDGEDADASSWCRFMNHASEDTKECNVETRHSPQIWDGTEIIQPRLWYVALRDIQIGEELLYDYGDCYWD